MPRSIRRILKRTLISLSMGSVIFMTHAEAQTVALSWDAATSDPDGYELYLRRIGEDYDYARPNYRGPDAFCEVDVEEDGIIHYYIIRTYVESQYSAFSDEISFLPPPLSADRAAKSSKVDSDELEGHFKNSSVSVLWPNGERGVDLAPVLILSCKSKNLPHTIRWQISTNVDMSEPVLAATRTDQNLTFKVPDMLLDTDTQYYWRADFYDENGAALKQTKVAPFVTISSHRSDDLNYNGILDSQELEVASDLDGNGIADYDQSGLLCVKAAKGNVILGVKNLSPNASLVAIRAYDENKYHNSHNKPEIINYGLLGVKLFLKDGSEKAEIKVYFSTPVDQMAMWYKFDSQKGWSVYENARFSEDRKSVIFTLIDGGYGDEDGVKNGIIVDPSGIGMMSQATGTDGIKYSGCIIDASTFAN